MGQLLLQNSFELRILAGVIIIIFSLHIIGVINLKILNYEKIQTNTNKNILLYTYRSTFGFGWTPCIGPILGSILALAATEEALIKNTTIIFTH